MVTTGITVSGKLACFEGRLLKRQHIKSPSDNCSGLGISYLPLPILQLHPIYPLQACELHMVCTRIHVAWT